MTRHKAKISKITKTLFKNNLLFISDTYYPQWKVKIDEKPATLLIADYAFRAVSVPKGNHSVTFFYDPKDFKIGLGLAGLGLIILFFSLFYIKNNEKKL